MGNFRSPGSHNVDEACGFCDATAGLGNAHLMLNAFPNGNPIGRGRVPGRLQLVPVLEPHLASAAGDHTRLPSPHETCSLR